MELATAEERMHEPDSRTEEFTQEVERREKRKKRWKREESWRTYERLKASCSSSPRKESKGSGGEVM